jgi:predicted transcriptional regulator
MAKSASSPTMTTTGVRMPTRLRSRLQKLAAATDRSRNYLIVEAIENFLEVNEWQIKAIKESLDDDSEMVDGKDVEAWLSTWGADDEKAPPWK